MRTAGRLVALWTLIATATLASAPAAIAADGVGLWGRADDKVITLWSFAVMGFFAVLVIGLSIIQIRLENRKDRIRDDLERLRR